jgi:hypothetical protein
MAGTLQEQRDGARWFFGALMVAILFTLFLVNTDYRLSSSDREMVLGRELLRLRSAQTTLASRVTDVRQVSPFVTDLEGSR